MSDKNPLYHGPPVKRMRSANYSLIKVTARVCMLILETEKDVIGIGLHIASVNYPQIDCNFRK